MKKLGLMGRVAVSFIISTVLPIFLFFLSTRRIVSIEQTVIILVLAGIFLIAWIYNGFLKPVNVLKEAARRIESGDLNFHLRRKVAMNLRS